MNDLLFYHVEQLLKDFFRKFLVFCTFQTIDQVALLYTIKGFFIFEKFILALRAQLQSPALSLFYSVISSRNTDSTWSYG